MFCLHIGVWQPHDHLSKCVLFSFWNLVKRANYFPRNLLHVYIFCKAVLSYPQTVGFQGRHRDKQRITYKKEGDGFLADCICSDGYTYAFHFHHQPASKQLWIHLTSTINIITASTLTKLSNFFLQSFKSLKKIKGKDF